MAKLERDILIMALKDCLPRLEAAYQFCPAQSKFESDAPGVALLWPPPLARTIKPPTLLGYQLALSDFLDQEIELVNLRQAELALSQEIIAAGEVVFELDQEARLEFEALVAKSLKN